MDREDRLRVLADEVWAPLQRCLANAQRASRRRLTFVRRLAVEPVAPAPEPDPVLDEALARLGSADQQVLRLWA